MYRWTNYASYGLMFAASLTLGAIGCSKTGPAPAASQSAPAADAGAHDHDHGATDAVAEAFASLSPEDRAAAEKQKICPVSDEPLGSMGTPIKVTVKGRDVFLCCAGCKKPIEEDPDKYLAKLDN
jgi:hypothetical protein